MLAFTDFQSESISGSFQHSQCSTLIAFVPSYYDSSYRPELGIGLVGFGITFLFLGIMLFFDRGLLAIGNVRSLSGTKHV